MTGGAQWESTNGLEARRAEENRQELAECIARAIPEDGMAEPIKGLFLNRASAPTDPVYGVSNPAFCVIAQGSKAILVGEDRYRYDPAHYLIYTAALPVAGQIIEATGERPYLSLRLDLEPGLVGSILVEVGQAAPRGNADVRAVDVSPLNAELLDATVRLARLLCAPDEARVLAPLVIREILFRLLMGEQGRRLRHLIAGGGSTDRIVRAIAQIRQDFDQPLRIDDLARDLGMSTSGFHHQFKVVTAMTPLQFQKQLRLQEARRLMLTRDVDAATAGYRVGYEDASHFSREYKRLFGTSPMRDVERLREVVTTDRI